MSKKIFLFCCQIFINASIYSAAAQMSLDFFNESDENLGFQSCNKLDEQLQQSLALNRVDIETVKSLVKKGANPSLDLNSGEQLLHHFIKNNNVDLSLFLIQSKANVDALDKSYHNQTALHLAAARNQCDVISALLKEKANINAADANSCKPLHDAIISEQSEAVKLLIESNADLNNIRNTDNVIHVGIDSNNINMLESLINFNESGEKNRKANLNAPDAQGSIPLTKAYNNHNHDAVQLLLNANAVVFATESDDNSLLVEVINNNDIDYVKKLIDQNAILNYRYKNQTMLEYAQNQQVNPEIIRLLQTNGAKTTSQIKQAHTKKHLQRANGKKIILAVLLTSITGLSIYLAYVLYKNSLEQEKESEKEKVEREKQVGKCLKPDFNA